MALSCLLELAEEEGPHWDKGSSPAEENPLRSSDSPFLPDQGPATRTVSWDGPEALPPVG